MILNESSVFNTLADDDIQRLEPLFEKRGIQPGDILATAKEPAQFFFLLNKGTLLLEMEEGKSVVLNSLGDFVGLELLSANEVYKTTIIVLEKGSLFAVARQNFLDFIQKDSPAAAAIMTSWQTYLDAMAPFAKNLEDLSLLEHF